MSLCYISVSLAMKGDIVFLNDTLRGGHSEKQDESFPVSITLGLFPEFKIFIQ